MPAGVADLAVPPLGAGLVIVLAAIELTLQCCGNVRDVRLEEHDDPDPDEVVELFEAAFIFEPPVRRQPVQLSLDGAGVLHSRLHGVMVQAIVPEPGPDGVPDRIRGLFEARQQRLGLLQGVGYE